MAISHKHPYKSGYKDMREGASRKAKRAINRIRRENDKKEVNN